MGLDKKGITAWWRVTRTWALNRKQVRKGWSMTIKYILYQERENNIKRGT